MWNYKNGCACVRYVYILTTTARQTLQTRNFIKIIADINLANKISMKICSLARSMVGFYLFKGIRFSKHKTRLWQKEIFRFYGHCFIKIKWYASYTSNSMIKTDVFVLIWLQGTIHKFCKFAGVFLARNLPYDIYQSFVFTAKAARTCIVLTLFTFYARYSGKKYLR